MSNGAETTGPSEETRDGSRTMKVIAWLSAGVVVAAAGILVGRELRNRYRFNRRTPYDFYANSGENEFGESGFGI